MGRPEKRSRRGIIFKGLLLAFLTIILLPSVVGLVRAAFACRMWEKPVANELGSATSDAGIQEITKQIPGYSRAEDQTYLTFPEWYIVYSADEYAGFISKNPPSQFPYFKAVGQYWQSYNDVCTATHARYPFNGSYQFTLGFIGVSFTVENMIKGMYETTIGRLTEWVSSDELTTEDAYAAQTAKEYGDFLHHTPWYDFPFPEKLKGLWNETDFWGPNPIRKWERKLALTLEYGIKAIYGGAISRASRATYGGPDETKIYAVVKGVTNHMTGPDFEIIKSIDEERQVVYITRFEVFSQIVPPLLQDKLRFIEIAGNDELLFTIIGPRGESYKFQYGQFLFDLPILTQPDMTRAAFKVRVQDMHLFFEELSKQKAIKFEHIYDY